MRPRLLLLAVFVAGLVTLGVELTASRLLGNVFGTSNLVWANIIGLILVYLTAGYFIGGRWADRSPRASTFYALLTWASLSAGLVPLAARPVLRLAAQAVEHLDAAVMLGSFASVLVLFSLPVTLLGCVSPFAIRIALKETGEAGRTSGRIYAISTLGSILGTFLPVLWLIPAIGTARTFLALSLVLMVVGFAGLWIYDRKRFVRLGWMPFLLLGLSWVSLRGGIKSTAGQIFEAESAYNYIQVVERDGVRLLMLNEGQAIHSVYAPGMRATYGTWDYFLTAPYWNPPPVSEHPVERVGIVGLAAGTIARQYTMVFGPIPIDGWEIDPEIVEVGRTYFDMREPNLNVIVADGRWGLTHSQAVYDVIGVDAYQAPYIPWQLTTREFFQEVRARLSSRGVLVINVGRTPDDRRVVDAMSGTMRSVFDTVHVVDVPASLNTLLYGTVTVTERRFLEENFQALASRGADPLLLDVLGRSLASIRPTPDSSTVFTDDRAPIEQLTNSIVLRFYFSGDLNILR